MEGFLEDRTVELSLVVLSVCQMEGPLQVYEHGYDSDGGEGWGQGYR